MVLQSWKSNCSDKQRTAFVTRRNAGTYMQFRLISYRKYIDQSISKLTYQAKLSITVPDESLYIMIMYYKGEIQYPNRNLDMTTMGVINS